MKKLVCLLMFFLILVLMAPCSFAEDAFEVEHIVIDVDEELCNINIVAPYFKGFENAEEIDRHIRNLIADSIGNARPAAKSLKNLKDELMEKGEETFDWEVVLITNYDYMINADILSLKLNTYYYSGGAHGMSYINSITMNIKTGKIDEFKDLFKDNVNYDEKITQIILDEIEKSSNIYFDNYKETILSKNGEYNYYIDGDKLVIYFDLYDIAPYVAGIPRFSIEAEEIKEFLKDEVYNSIKDGKERGIISYNGADIDSNSKIFYQDQYTPLVPLRVIAESLGYTVDWNREYGAMVNGNTVENSTIVDGITYVPIEYFTEILGENVVFDISVNGELLIKVYNKTGQENNFNNLIAEFELPITAEDTVKMYAEAVKMRNGAVQYGLMSDELRDKKYYEFNELGFVTGTSSPWVDSYEIENIGDNIYKVIFHLRTSVLTDLITSIVKVELIQDGNYWRISSIEEM